MQTTLLSLAIAVILALVAALVGPHVIDWNRYRPAFEAEASRLTGQPVRVTGIIDARLLPTPTLVASGIEVGPPGADHTLRARALGIEFGLGALMRGELRATHMRISAPEIVLALDPSGKVALPGAVAGFSVDALAIDQLIVEDGRLTLADAASRSRIVLDKLWFKGEMRSLAGPFKGEGAFLFGGGLYGYRVQTARLDESGLRMKLGIDPTDQPLSIEGDGVLSFDRGAPRFEGGLAFARPAGVALADGSRQLNEPWQTTARVKATGASALFEQIEFKYGSEERSVRLTGTAEFKFGARPRLGGVLSARQFDLDRLIATPDAPRQLPFSALRAAMARFSGGFRLPVPVQIGLGIDTLTLGGAAIQNLRGDIRFDNDSWSLESIEFRAPGLSQIQLSGRLEVMPGGIDFSGPADIASADPRALFAWLEGRGEAMSATPRPMRARGEVALGSERIGVERLQAEIDRKAVNGRLSYLWANADRPARLEAELTAAEIDLDALFNFGTAALAGSKIERPGEVALALAIGRATMAGVEARNVNARLKFGGQGLEIERLSVNELGGAALRASGRIDTSGPSPRGSLNLDLVATELDSLVTLAARFAPQSADQVRRYAKLLAPAKLRATLETESAGAQPGINIGVEGQAGVLRVGMKAHTNGNLADLKDVRLESRIATDDGAALFGLLGLDRVAHAEKRPQQFSVTASGPFHGDLRIDAKLAGELDAALNGVIRIGGDKDVAGTANVSVSKADLRNLRPPVGGKAPDALPVAFTGQAALNGKMLSLSNLSANVGGAALRGKLGVDFGASPARVQGEVDADAIDVPAILASAFGAPPAKGPGWPPEPFSAGRLPPVEGALAVRAGRAALTPALSIRNFRATADIRAPALELRNLQGELGGGRIGGQISFRKNADALSSRGSLSITGADAAAILPGDGRAIAGRLDLKVEAEGGGLSLKTLIGSLAGNGVVTIENAQFSNLDATAFPAIVRAVDQGLALDANRIRPTVQTALDAGKLVVPRLEAAFAIAAGQARIATVVARSEGAELTDSGNLDLAESNLDVQLILSSLTSGDVAGAGRPEIGIGLRGPVASPARTIDVAALAGWLALRTVEQQTKKLEEAERQAAIRAREEAEQRRRDEAERAARLREEAARAREAAPAQPPAPASGPAPSDSGNAAARPERPPVPSVPPPIDIRP
ncbi:MAG: AsmA family protein, partial [Pseudorhodoplanes sp.]